ncbi:ImmA/IrrE family metallo-endopeptidase [Rhodococcus sovatensis]|uniref:ImmA/IrrE family metallo-endopeptidase n=1 Tax=Rhodococcus sovatensis TaxID=1805840 RepID=UPI003BB0DA57
MDLRRVREVRFWDKVRRSVNKIAALCEAADGDGHPSIERVVAIATAGPRPVEVRNARLPWGVFGRWLRYPDKDVFEVADGLPSRDWTIAHELGHLVLGHGKLFSEIGSTASLRSEPSTVMSRSCGAASHERCELEAERFAALLLDRLRVIADLSASGTQELLG